MQIIFIAFHLKLFVFDKDYLYLMNELVYFSFVFLKQALGLILGAGNS